MNLYFKRNPSNGEALKFLFGAFVLFFFSSLGWAQSSRFKTSPKLEKDQKIEENLLSEEKKSKFSKAHPEDMTNENFPEKIASFDYPNAEIAEVVKAISKLTGKNFILDANVRGRITIIAPTEITVAEAYKAFLSALAMNSFTVVPSGRFLKIRQSRAARQDSIQTYTGSYFPDTDQIITRIVRLKFIKAPEVHKNLRALISKDGDISPYAPTNSLIISDYGSNIERISRILADLDVPGFEEQLAVIRIEYAKAKDIADLIDQIINKGENKRGGRVSSFRRTTKSDSESGGTESYSLVIADDRSNSLIVVGNTAGIKKIRSLVRKLDFPLRPEDAGGVYVYYVRFGEAEKIADVLNGIASEAKKKQDDKDKATTTPGRRITRPSTTNQSSSDGTPVFGGDVQVTADKVTNSLIITAGRPDYDVVKNLLAKIDIPRDQVFVKAIILEMGADKTTEWGIDYYKFQKGTDGVGRSGFRTSDITSLTNPASDSGAILGFGSGETVKVKFGGTSEFEVKSLMGLVKFLKKTLNANILSTPQIMTLANEEGMIEVGQTVPVGSETTQNGTTSTTSIKREKATIKLTITPYISPESNVVRLKIKQVIKQVDRAKVESTDLQKAAVVTNDRNIETTAVVESGNTAVLGGLILDQESNDVRKVPILGDIPILGWLFKSTSVVRKKTNLVMFITPKIIRSLSDNEDLLNQKIDERIDFIQRYMGGRDPHGQAVDDLPRTASSSQTLDEEEREELEEEKEEPAVESF